MLSAGASLPPPYSAQQDLQTCSFKGTLATPLRGEGCGTELTLRGDLVAKRSADLCSLTSAILVLKWVIQRHLWLHVIPLAFWRRVKKLLLNIQCELEVNRFFPQEEIMPEMGWGGGALLHVSQGSHWMDTGPPATAVGCGQWITACLRLVVGLGWDLPAARLKCIPLWANGSCRTLGWGCLGWPGPYNLRLGQCLWNHLQSLPTVGAGFCGT